MLGDEVLILLLHVLDDDVPHGAEGDAVVQWVAGAVGVDVHLDGGAIADDEEAVAA